MKNAEQFKTNLLEAGVLSPEGVHHKFRSGLHGRKIDFEKITPDNPLFDQWIEQNVQKIRQVYAKKLLGRVAIISVAGGTNLLAPMVAVELGDNSLAYLSSKTRKTSLPRLEGKIAERLDFFRPDLSVILEDVGTTGKSSATIAAQLLDMGIGNTEVLVTWQRRPELEELHKIGVNYHSIINDNLEDFTPSECAKSGFCARGWDFVDR